MTVEFRDDFDVDLVNYMGSDELICRAARVSTLGAASLETHESAGLLGFLLKNRHGTPFEHGAMTFRITAPIFVWREFMRHRIGFSYNEQSGRYMEMIPMFYVPHHDRAIVQQGKPGHYEFVKGTYAQQSTTRVILRSSYERSWVEYQLMLDRGVAKEVARMCLPVGIYSTAYVTCNPRSMMSFLSLRSKGENSMFPSYPMYEIHVVANMMEDHFRGLFPITWKHFDSNGRVAP